MHPDSAFRIESFINLADQVEREKLQGRDATKKPDELLATVASGWAKGKNGATTNVDLAIRVWNARAPFSPISAARLNRRNELLTEIRQAKPVPIDELGQIVSLLPPAEPENLAHARGTSSPQPRRPARYLKAQNRFPSHCSQRHPVPRETAS